MTNQDYLAREARERDLWRRYPREMQALAPGDLPEYATDAQRRVWARWRDRYRAVLSGHMTVRAAMRALRSEVQP